MGEFQKDLYMPVNAPDADDFIQGVGAFELYVYMIGFCTCAIVGLFVNAVFANTMVAMFSAIVLFAGVVLVFRRDIFNENLIKKVRIIMLFSKSQKVYKYHYFNIYEVQEID